MREQSFTRKINQEKWNELTGMKKKTVNQTNQKNNRGQNTNDNRKWEKEMTKNRADYLVNIRP